MAKLGFLYSLCPLIQQSKFLGVSEDSSNRFIVVTLSKNVAFRYNLSDQRMVRWWSSTDKFGAPVVYDAENKNYIGLFNGERLGFWDESATNINKVKKMKFLNVIFTVLSCKELEPIVVYKNGSFGFLSQELEQRKQPRPSTCLIKNDETLDDAQMITIDRNLYLSLFTVAGKKEEDPEDRLLNHQKRTVHFFLLTGGRSFSIELSRPDCETLIGYAFSDFEHCLLITIWSDGKMYVANLSNNPEGIEFPGKLVMVVKSIDTSAPVAIASLSSMFIALYGAKTNSEGARLSLVNIKLGLLHSSHELKLYRRETKLWRCGEQHLLFLTGGYLAVSRFVLGSSVLASLVGTKMEEEAGCSTSPNWGLPQTSVEDVAVKDLPNERLVQDTLPSLLETQDMAGMFALVDTVRTLPGPSLIQALTWSLENDERLPLLRRLLLLPITSDGPTLGMLRAALRIPDLINVLDFIQHGLEEETDPAIVGSLLQWSGLLLDSHYQEALLSKDPLLIQTLTSLRDTVTHMLEYMDQLQSLRALLLNLHKPKRDRKKCPTNSDYTIEKINLY